MSKNPEGVMFGENPAAEADGFRPYRSGHKPTHARMLKHTCAKGIHMETEHAQHRRKNTIYGQFGLRDLA